MSTMTRASFVSLMLAAPVAAGGLSWLALGEEAGQSDAVTLAAGISASAWRYNADAGVYWQVGVPYCTALTDAAYQTLGVFVPGAFMEATDNGDGTFTCAVNPSGAANGISATDAPIVIPVNTPGYAAMEAPTDYVDDATAYAAAGYVYVSAGCRGRETGAPWGVVDLKAAIRFLRANAASIPGSTERIFTFGMSGGGAQSALLGASGDSQLFTPYLQAIGAVMDQSDAVAGSMCWCPVTSLDYADAAYEWNLGSSRAGLDETSQAISDGLSGAFADHLNSLGLVGDDGAPLVLEPSETGIYQAGSYYDYLMGVVEGSLNDFLADTTFPYTPSSPSGGHGGPGGPTGTGDVSSVAGDAQAGGFVDASGQFQSDGIDRASTGSSEGLTLSGTYETAQAYIDALNANGAWVTYDPAGNTATITSLADFVNRLKTASKGIGAFDALDASQGENVLFGSGDGRGAHFDAVLAGLVAGTEYETAFTTDLAKVDVLGSTVTTRVSMYSPLYYLCAPYEGANTSSVAPHWRIRSGIFQGDTALTTEVNLALALRAHGCQTDFATVWGQAHTMAERTGNSTDNFIQWVASCLGQESGKVADAAGEQPTLEQMIAETAPAFELRSYEDAETGVTLQYYLFSPAGGADTYPLIQFIPDASVVGAGTEAVLTQGWGGLIWASAYEQAKHPCYVLVPVFSEVVVDDNFNVSAQVTAEKNLLSELCTTLPIDPGRLYTTGQSMGGMTSFHLNLTYPDLFTASLFVGSQWDTTIMQPMEDKRFFYIVAAGDAKASAGQADLKAVFDADGVPYASGEWSAQEDEAAQSQLAQALVDQGQAANFVTFEAGSTLADGQGAGKAGEHMTSFDYAYKIESVRDWLFAQSK